MAGRTRTAPAVIIGIATTHFPKAVELTLVAKRQAVLVAWVRACALCIASRSMLSTKSVIQAIPAFTTASGQIGEVTGIIARRFGSVWVVAGVVAAARGHVFNREVNSWRRRNNLANTVVPNQRFTNATMKPSKVNST